MHNLNFGEHACHGDFVNWFKDAGDNQQADALNAIAKALRERCKTDERFSTQILNLVDHLDDDGNYLVLVLGVKRNELLADPRTDEKGIIFVYDGEAVRNEQRRILDRQEVPERCPACGNDTLWPKPHQVRNVSSRRKGVGYVCDLCGQREAMEDFNSRSK